MRRSKKQLQIFSLSFLDVICCGLGAVLIVLLFYSVKLREREKKASELTKQNSSLISENKNYSERLLSVSNQLILAQSKISKLEKNTVPTTEYAKLKSELSELKKNKISITEYAKLKSELSELKKNKISITEVKNLKEKLKKAKDRKTILGVSISKKKLIFLIDASGSMEDKKGDTRLSDAKGAFKAMLASLDSSYSIDLVWFTSDSISTKIKGLWKRLEKISDIKKREGMDFITDIEPLGGTPTFGAVKYVIKTYPTAEAIVLLSDGVPTDFSTKNYSNCEKSASEINKITKGEIPIYCIGVGKEMANKYSEARKFLEQVAKESGGDCVTF